VTEVQHQMGSVLRKKRGVATAPHIWRLPAGTHGRVPDHGGNVSRVAR